MEFLDSLISLLQDTKRLSHCVRQARYAEEARPLGTHVVKENEYASKIELEEWIKSCIYSKDHLKFASYIFFHGQRRVG